MTEERLRRKINQHWEMAGLARMEGDHRDADRHLKLARKYEDELNNR